MNLKTMTKKALLEKKIGALDFNKRSMDKVKSGVVLSKDELNKCGENADLIKNINKELELRNGKGDVETMTKNNFSNEEKDFLAYLRGEDKRNLRALNLSGNKAIMPTTIASKVVDKVHEIIDYTKCSVYDVKGALVIPVAGADIICEDIVEGTQIGDHAGDFTTVKLEAQAVGKIIKIGRSLLNNVDFDLMGFLVDRLALAIANTIDKKVVTAVFASENVGTDTATGTYTYDKINETFVKMKAVLAQDGEWVMNRDEFAKVSVLKDAEGHFLVQNGVVNGEVCYVLLGKKVTLSENAPTGKIAFVNLKGIALKFSTGINIEPLVEFRSSYQEALLGSTELDAKIENTECVFVLSQGA